MTCSSSAGVQWVASNSSDKQSTHALERARPSWQVATVRQEAGAG